MSVALRIGVTVRTLVGCVVAAACARGAGVAGNAGEVSDAAVPLPTLADSGIAVVLDGGLPGTPDAAGSSELPDPGDLSLLTAAPPKPHVDAICNATSVTPAPPGKHPGPCAIVGVETNSYEQDVFTVRRAYVDGGIGAEQREEWSEWLDGGHPVYDRTTLGNTYDGTGRLQRSIKRTYLAEPDSEFNYTLWEESDYTYADGGFSTRKFAARNEPPSPPLPALVELDDFVLDALGKIILTRERRLDIGTWRDGQVTLHPNGVEASETWKGRTFWEDVGGNIQFDDAGNPLLEDNFSFRSGNGTNRAHITYAYDGGRLMERHIDSGLYSDWPGEPQEEGSRTTETYRYDRARLVGIETTSSYGSCAIDQADRACVANCTWISKCTWTAGAGQHTAFRYDDYGNLIERTVTDDAGKETSRWTAVADRDGNVLCEQQTDVRATSFSRRYDYSCW